MSKNPLTANLERYRDKFGVVYQIEKVENNFVLSLVNFKKEMQGRGYKRNKVVVEALNTYLVAPTRDACWLYLLDVATSVQKI